MSRAWILFPATLALVVSQLSAQSSSNQQDLTVQVPSTPGWTDTGLDLQSGDVLKISAEPGGRTASGTLACDPAGLPTQPASTAGLPLPSASAGALIARLHTQGAAPILIGARNELHVEASSHLFLGMNVSDTPPCGGGFKVHVQRNPSSNAAAADGTSQANRKDQLKSQLATAAQVFMEGQFGLGKSSTASSPSSSAASSGGDNASPAARLAVSNKPLDADLRKSLDGLPRRVNDQFNNLGDMVNFVIVGSQKDVQAALEAASWHIADTDNRGAVLNAVMQTYDSKDYLAMPMSTLYLFGRKQDFGYEMAEPIAMVASRHHFRIWKASVTWHGQQVWVGAGTHDIGFAKDKRNNNVTHKIDPAVDGERDNIGSSLQKVDKTRSLTYYLPPNPVQEAKNATLDGYHSDGRLLVIFLQ